MPEIQNQRMREFFDQATAFIEKTTKVEGSDPCHAIRPEDPEWQMWVDYLRARCGELPAAMRMVLGGQLDSATMPARRPDWFDASYDVDRAPYRTERQPPRRGAPIRRDWMKHPSWEKILRGESDRIPDYVPGPEERARIEEGFAALKRELASANLSMANPHPLPEDRITRTPGAISAKLKPYVPPRTDWTPGTPLDADALAALPSARTRR